MRDIKKTIAKFAEDNLVSVTLEYQSGPGLHDVRYVYTNMSGASLQTFVPSEGMRVVGICSLDDDWE